MSVPSSSSTEPACAYPPRFWWLKRISFLVLLALLAVGGLRWWWGRIAEARLNEAIAAARARHEPILPEDFPTPSLPEDRNAAATLKRAAASLTLGANWDAMSRWEGGPLTPAELLRVEAIAGSNGLPLRLVRLARSQPDADWGIGFPSAAHLRGFGLPRQSELSRLEQWVAIRDHSQGSDSEAMEHVLDLLRQADAFDQGGSSYLLHLVATGVRRQTTAVLEAITPDLRIASAPGSPSAHGGAAHAQQVKEVIARLLEERYLREGAIGVFDGAGVGAIEDVDASCHYWYFDQMVEYSAPELWLVRPMFVLDASQLLTALSMMRSAVTQPNWPAAKRKLPSSDMGWTDLDRYVDVMRVQFSFSRSIGEMLDFPTLTDRRAAAIALAIRLYCVDHDGRFPAELAELVPAYLPDVPLDPMAAGGRPFGYHPSAHPPVIYSVGGGRHRQRRHEPAG